MPLVTSSVKKRTFDDVSAVARAWPCGFCRTLKESHLGRRQCDHRRALKLELKELKRRSQQTGQKLRMMLGGVFGVSSSERYVRTWPAEEPGMLTGYIIKAEIPTEVVEAAMSRDACDGEAGDVLGCAAAAVMLSPRQPGMRVIRLATLLIARNLGRG